jgi:2-deoxy-D-gluconate 3-dehydrogenase
MVVQRAIDAFGRLDVVVNNAGIAISAPALEYPEDAWDEVVDTSLKGSFLMSQAGARVMASESGGRIINLSSTFARRPYRRVVAYAAAKAGIEQLTRVLALEWAENKITVNAIALTSIVTETRAHFFTDPKRVEQRIAEIPLGRLGIVEDAVSAALFLAGPAGAFVTGHTLLVDGGFTLG